MSEIVTRNTLYSYIVPILFVGLSACRVRVRATSTTAAVGVYRVRRLLFLSSRCIVYITRAGSIVI